MKEFAILAREKISFSMDIFLMNEQSLLKFELAFTRGTAVGFILSHFLFYPVFTSLPVLESYVPE